MTLNPAVEITADGSATLRSPINGDTYHSLRGAVGEARHVFIEAGFLTYCREGSVARHCEEPQATRQSDKLMNRLPRRFTPRKDGDCRVATLLAMTGSRNSSSIKVLEMGFGTGLNAWLTLEEAQRTGRAVEYTAVELYPVPEETAAKLVYTPDKRFMAMHRAPWGERTEIDERFGLQKLNIDLASTVVPGSFDLVYWDAFAPDTQPELWTAEIFARIFETMSPGGILVTYSSKGDVRRALQAAGFKVEKLPGALGKRHMLRAQKIMNYD
jgi:tRNA U34 5-methylaminomethyl-2-thiouridine-forming methyltransferase MnmC